MLLKAGSRIRVRATGELRLENPAVTMDEAEARLRGKGTEILERNDADRTFKVLDEAWEQTLAVDTEFADGAAVEVLS